MAGPIGMAVLRGIKAVTCPHCGTRQARGRHVTGQLTCKKCKKVFELPAEPKARKR
jgi:ribosomal protein L37AE/L43A